MLASPLHAELRYWRRVEKELRIHTVFQIISTRKKQWKSRWGVRSCGGPTEQVDDAFIIGSEEPDRVFKEEHEGRIDDSVRQLVGIDLEGCSQHTHRRTLISWQRWNSETRETGRMELAASRRPERQTAAVGGFTFRLTLKSRRASIWFWIMGIVLSSFSVFMVLITPSTLHARTRGVGGVRGFRKGK